MSRHAVPRSTLKADRLSAFRDRGMATPHDKAQGVAQFASFASPQVLAEVDGDRVGGAVNGDDLAGVDAAEGLDTSASTSAGHRYSPVATSMRSRSKSA
jgi:hypothetical protein